MPITSVSSAIRHDGPEVPRPGHSMGLWCSLITRSVSLKSAEARSKEAEAAIKKELDGLRARKTWDEDHPMELDDLYKDKRYPDAMIGRVFGIMGVKGDEMRVLGAPLDMKFRDVFQGNNVRTKSGTSAFELYEEISNSLASFTASRLALGCAAANKLREIP